MQEQSIKEILKNTTEENADQVDWTKAWSKRYPVLGIYQSQVDIPKYASQIRALLEDLKTVYGYSELDAVLVLKDILAHEMKKEKTPRKKARK